MAILPDRYEALITYLENQAGVWGQDPGTIGLSEEQVEAVALAAERARQAFTAAHVARNAAEAATQALKLALGDARSAASTAIDAIKLHARVSGQGNSVYNAAQIPPPANPSLLPRPGTPEVFETRLDQTGELTLRWTCKHPRGSRNVVYLIERRTPGGSKEFIGSTGAKSFRDESLPAGVPWAEYTITAQRGSSRGGPCIRTVRLGTAPALPALRSAAA